MKRAYVEWNPKPVTVALVHIAEAIIEEYLSNGYILTLRQLYYQFVAKGIIENSERSYKNLGNAMTKARMAGMISWEAIEDRSRGHNSFWYDEELLSPIKALPQYIRFDRWARQDAYVEVWVEKEALGNVIARACDPYLVPHLSCKGYLSASEAWRAGRRFRKKFLEGKDCHLIHLGDHDPSGIDMTRDNRDRMAIFTECMDGVTVKRLALNMDQVEKYDPPPNPAKITDSRATGYIKRFGKTSWELDALEPQVMEDMIRREIRQYIDPDIWKAVGEEQDSMREVLKKVHTKWDQIRAIVEG